MTEGMYKHLTQEELTDGTFIVETLGMLSEEERKGFLIYASAMRDMALFRSNKKTA